MKSITSFLTRHVAYDSVTGVFSWREQPQGSRKKVEYKHGRYYRITGIGRQRILSHRAAWFLTYGFLPEQAIDHIDGNPANNSIANLRLATPQMNSQNRYTSSGVSGLLGVTKRQGKHGTRYRASIRVNGKLMQLGTYVSAKEAHEIYLSAKRHFHQLGGEIARNSENKIAKIRLSATKQKNIYFNKNGFQVKFRVNKTNLCLGTYSDLITAIHVRDTHLAKQISDEALV